MPRTGPRRHVSADGEVTLSSEALESAGVADQVEPTEPESLWDRTDAPASVGTDAIDAQGSQYPEQSGVVDQRSVGPTPSNDPREFQPGLERHDRAGRIG